MALSVAAAMKKDEEMVRLNEKIERLEKAVAGRFEKGEPAAGS